MLYKKILIYCLASLGLFVGDLFHVNFQIATYSGNQGPRLGNIPIWVFAEFFFATYFLVNTYPIKKKIFRFNDNVVSLGKLLFNFTLTIMIYLITSLSEDWYLYKFIFLTVAFFIQLKLLKIYDVFTFIDLFLVAMGGCLVEFILGQLNIFQYKPSPSIVFTIPLWLPFIYLSAAISARLGGIYFYGEKDKRI